MPAAAEVLPLAEAGRIRIKTFSEQTVDHIKKLLLDGQLRPGDPVRESGIAASLGISRGPVREALQRLAQEGLITGEPQKQRIIRKMSAREIEDSYELGGSLEGLCVVQSLDLYKERHFTALAGILAEMEKLAAMATGLSDLEAADEQFHSLLLEPCPNRLMVKTARSSCAHISKFLYFNLWNHIYAPFEFVRRHELVLNSIRQKRPLAILKVLAEHYTETGHRLGMKARSLDMA